MHKKMWSLPLTELAQNKPLLVSTFPDLGTIISVWLDLGTNFISFILIYSNKQVKCLPCQVCSHFCEKSKQKTYEPLWMGPAAYTASMPPVLAKYTVKLFSTKTNVKMTLCYIYQLAYLFLC